MDGKTMEEVRKALLARRQHLQKDEGKDQPTEIPDNDTPQAEIIDIAQTLEQLDRDMSLAEQERRELIAIERALSKMATPSFGVCEDCGEEIPARRLIAVPEARFCANCQAMEERQNIRGRLSGIAAR
ncbi:MAG: hypothetical protein A2X94_16715 [Bdellovibrionales bacterium GWB1_55_8]|nr:MAG: hypothetical protein A2X94_16715 [Bdellovibrionales bacterium GWB1_55_8]